MGQTQVKQVKPVKGNEKPQNAQERNNLEYPPDPGRCKGIDRHFQGLAAVFLGSKSGCKSVNNQRDDEDHDNRHDNGDDGTDDSCDHRRPERAEKRYCPPDYGPTYESRYGTDCRQRNDVAHQQFAGLRLFFFDDVPFIARIQTDFFRALDNVHEVAPGCKIKVPHLTPRSAGDFNIFSTGAPSSYAQNKKRRHAQRQRILMSARCRGSCRLQLIFTANASPAGNARVRSRSSRLHAHGNRSMTEHTGEEQWVAANGIADREGESWRAVALSHWKVLAVGDQGHSPGPESSSQVSGGARVLSQVPVCIGGEKRFFTFFEPIAC